MRWPASCASVPDVLNSLGCPCQSAAAKALPAPTGRVEIELPSARDAPEPSAARAVPTRDVSDKRLTCAMEDLGSVCDRESDFWHLLAHAVDDGDALLVRVGTAARTRCPCSPSRPPRPGPTVSVTKTRRGSGCRQMPSGRLPILQPRSRPARPFVRRPPWPRPQEPAFAMQATEAGSHCVRVPRHFPP